jgi:hypothetical protein
MTSLDEYRQLIRELDAELSRFRHMPGALMHCAPGCAQCCAPLAVFPIEAQALLAAAGGWSPATDQDRCPLLTEDKRCRLYESRPLVCRVRGLPVFFIDQDGVPSRDFCANNRFPSAEPAGESEAVHLELWNARLYRLNQRFCADAGISAHRIHMNNLFRAERDAASKDPALSWLYTFSGAL